MTTLGIKPGDFREELRPERWFMITRSLTFQMLPDMAPDHLANDKISPADFLYASFITDDFNHSLFSKYVSYNIVPKGLYITMSPSRLGTIFPSLWNFL